MKAVYLFLKIKTGRQQKGGWCTINEIQNSSYSLSTEEENRLMSKITLALAVNIFTLIHASGTLTHKVLHMFCHVHPCRHCTHKHINMQRNDGFCRWKTRTSVAVGWHSRNLSSSELWACGTDRSTGMLGSLCSVLVWHVTNTCIPALRLHECSLAGFWLWKLWNCGNKIATKCLI